MSVVYFLLLTSLVVFVHELGHFIAAKLLGFQVLCLSVGFGKPVISVWKGGTQYKVGIVPIGGYVRIKGEHILHSEDTTTEVDTARADSLSRPLGMRLVVALAGPFANIVLAVLIYVCLFAGQSHLPAPIIGDVLVSGPAERAGLAPGDTILSINNEKVRYFHQVESIVRNSGGRELLVSVRRGRVTRDVYVTPLHRQARNAFGFMQTMGHLGIRREPIVPMIGVLDKSSPAADAGLRTGDVIVSLAGTGVTTWKQAEAVLHKQKKLFDIVLLRPVESSFSDELVIREPVVVTVDPVRQEKTKKFYTGIHSAELYVAAVVPGTPAYRVGLRRGDKIESMNGKQIFHWSYLEEAIRTNPDRSFDISWKRLNQAGKIESMFGTLSNIRRKKTDEFGQVVEVVTLGATNLLERGTPNMVPVHNRFYYSVQSGLTRAKETVGLIVTGIVSIFSTAKVDSSMGGPLMLLRAAGVSGDKGLSSFFLMLALISINLGLLNLLPIPVLDGGHAVTSCIEALRKKQLSRKSRRRLNWAGMSFIAAVTLLAIWSDIGLFLG